MSPSHITLPLGSSPRVRSRRHGENTAAVPAGIISACAEQTLSHDRRRCRRWDHLRVCGADYMLRYGYFVQRGSSPRVRSRRQLYSRHGRCRGIISACAEQTASTIMRVTTGWDHLRVCGADYEMCKIWEGNEGSSPRVRSRLEPQQGWRVGHRIISACAEQTLILLPMMCWSWDHLRVCGADTKPSRITPLPGGSSPRVRSRLDDRGQVVDGIGIISACAEQTQPEHG